MGTAKGPIDNISEREFVPLKEARGQVETAITRIALLHLAFSRTLVEEFGAEKGRSGKTLIRDSCEERDAHNSCCELISDIARVGRCLLPSSGYLCEH